MRQSCAKVNELIEMSFGGQTPVGKEFCALDSLRISSLAGRATFALMGIESGEVQRWMRLQWCVRRRHDPFPNYCTIRYEMLF